MTEASPVHAKVLDRGLVRRLLEVVTTVLDAVCRFHVRKLRGGRRYWVTTIETGWVPVAVVPAAVSAPLPELMVKMEIVLDPWLAT